MFINNSSNITSNYAIFRQIVSLAKSVVKLKNTVRNGSL